MTTEELLLKMGAVIWDGHAGLWFARATGCTQFAKAKTPREAMEAALVMLDPMPNADLF